MAIIDNKVIAAAKAFAKDVDDTTLTALWNNYLKPYLQAKMPGAFGKVSVSHTVSPYSKICYVSSRYRNLVRVYSDNGDWTILDTAGVVMARDEDIGKQITLTAEFGTDAELGDVEAVCGRMLAELATQVSRNAFGVESVSNSFDVSTLTTRYNWTDWEKYQTMLAFWWVDDMNKKEAGCLV